MKRTPPHPMLTWQVKKIEQAEKQPRFPQTWHDIWHSRLSVARMIWNSWGDINIRCNITYKFTNYKEVVRCALLAHTFGVTFRSVGCTWTTRSATPKDGEMWRCNSCGLALSHLLGRAGLYSDSSFDRLSVTSMLTAEPGNHSQAMEATVWRKSSRNWKVWNRGKITRRAFQTRWLSDQRNETSGQWERSDHVWWGCMKR